MKNPNAARTAEDLTRRIERSRSHLRTATLLLDREGSQEPTLKMLKDAHANLHASIDGLDNDHLVCSDHLKHLKSARLAIKRRLESHVPA